MEKNCSKRGINNWKILSEEVATCPLSDIWKLTRQQLVEQPEQPDLTLKLALPWGGSWTTGLQRSRPNYSTLFVSPAFWGKKEKLQKSSVKAELSSKVNRPYHRPKQNNNARRLPDLPKVTTSFTTKSTSETTDDWEGPQPDTRAHQSLWDKSSHSTHAKSPAFSSPAVVNRRCCPLPKSSTRPPHTSQRSYIWHTPPLSCHAASVILLPSSSALLHMQACTGAHEAELLLLHWSSCFQKFSAMRSVSSNSRSSLLFQSQSLTMKLSYRALQ